MAVTVYSTPYGYYARTTSGTWTPVDESTVDKGLLRGTYRVVKATDTIIKQIDQQRQGQSARVDADIAAKNDPCADVPEELLPLYELSGLCDGGAGTLDTGNGGPSLADQEYLARLQAEIDAAAAEKDYQRQLELLKLQQDFERELDDKRRAEEAERQKKQLMQERLQTYVELLGNDPVRAVLYALGAGGETTGLPTEQFEGLEPIAGAEQKKTETEKALGESLLKYGATGAKGKPIPGKTTSPKITNTGVEGLTSPEKVARLLAQGDESSRKLVSSAYGVGSKETGGLSPEELLKRARAVTPTGSLNY